MTDAILKEWIKPHGASSNGRQADLVEKLNRWDTSNDVMAFRDEVKCKRVMPSAFGSALRNGG